MKKIYLLFIFSLFIISCSGDDDSNNSTNPGNTSSSFLPSNNGNYWVYDVLDGKDSLYIANDTVINDKTYKKLKTQKQPIGFFSNALNNNAIRYSDNKIFLTGSAGFGFTQDLPLNIGVSDFVIFDRNASANITLGTITGTKEQEIQGFTIEFTYTLSSKALATLPTYTSGNENYSNVKPVEITLNLEIKAKLAGFPIEYTLLQPQNVVTSTQYYAENIGMIQNNTTISYNLEEIPIPDFELPIPQSHSEKQYETLLDYSVE